MDLQTMKREIDQIDSEMLKLLAKRFKMMDKFAEQKYINREGITDIKHEKEEFILWNNVMDSLGVNDPNFTKKLYTLVQEKSKELQEKKINELKDKI